MDDTPNIIADLGVAFGISLAGIVVLGVMLHGLCAIPGVGGTLALIVGFVVAVAAANVVIKLLKSPFTQS